MLFDFDVCVLVLGVVDWLNCDVWGRAEMYGNSPKKSQRFKRCCFGCAEMNDLKEKKLQPTSDLIKRSVFMARQDEKLLNSRLGNKKKFFFPKNLKYDHLT